MAEVDPCRQVLTPIDEAELFARDALRPDRGVMSENPAEAATGYLAVYALLAASALFPGIEDAGRSCGAPRKA